MSDPRVEVEYDRRLARWRDEVSRGERTALHISNLRLCVIAVAACLALAIIRGVISSWWFAGPVLAFLVLAIVHSGVLQRTERARRARRLYERGLSRLSGQWPGTGPDGARFLDDHPYARDLDLFGPGSLFQLLDVARTEVGEDTLADWLRQGAPIDETRARQVAIQELRPMVDFREAIALLAADTSIGRTSALARWAGTPPAGLPSRLGMAFAACAIITALLTSLVAAARFNSAALTAWLLVQSTLVMVWLRRIHLVLARIDLATHDLALLATLLERIERELFTSPRLALLRDALATAGMPPSRRIAQLQRLVTVVDTSRNLLFMPIAGLLLVRAQAAVAIDRWHAAYGPAIGLWLRAVGELEAFSALATYAYEHPADPFPVLVDGEAVFEADALAHPLLPEVSAVRNDVHLGGSGPRALVVSGSNMSGKSTLLRAVGVNVVLALAGGPVRASVLKLSRVALGATLRVQDSLQAGRSTFYAEILRIRTIVDVARGPAPLLFLLDEILGGTNSHDRRTGAEAIVRALLGSGAIGLITTHDLALTELAASLGIAVTNVHFEDRIENGVMVFDYRMLPGVVQRSNAIALMRSVGLDVS